MVVDGIWHLEQVETFGADLKVLVYKFFLFNGPSSNTERNYALLNEFATTNHSAMNIGFSFPLSILIYFFGAVILVTFAVSRILPNFD